MSPMKPSAMPMKRWVGKEVATISSTQKDKHLQIADAWEGHQRSRWRWTGLNSGRNVHRRHGRVFESWPILCNLKQA